jgi:hypothetical protein
VYQSPNILPRLDAKIFHLDVDPLKQQMIGGLFPFPVVGCHDLTLTPVYHIPASHRYKVSAELALKQLNRYLDHQKLDPSKYASAFEARSTRYKDWRATLASREVASEKGPIGVPYLMSRLRNALPKNATIALEAVTNALPAIHHLHLTEVSAFPSLPRPFPVYLC